MKISEVPEEYKIFVFVLKNGRGYIVNGLTKRNILNSKTDLIELGTEKGFNKSSLDHWEIDIEKTKEEVFKNKDKLTNI